MLYSIHKDEPPKNTVERIKSILKECGIDTVEKIISHENNQVASVRVCLKGCEEIGTNGKGTCIENALASGYSEFMERLQANYLIHFYPSGNDKKVIDNENIKKDLFCEVLNRHLIKKFYKLVKEKEYINHLKYCKVFPFELEDDKTEVLEFFSYKDKAIVNLPINEIRYLQTSTGLAAGNTYEEAIVQGISEIFERYSLKQILTKKVKMPIVPRQIYEQYDVLANLISFIENNGYKVTIKDASLGQKVPVICTIFEEKSTNGKNCFVSFGSQPYLPVAIERTLTEFLQNLEIEKEEVRQLIASNKVNEKCTNEDILRDFYHSYVSFSKYNRNFNFLFATKSSYEFDSSFWLYNEDLTNRDLSKKLCSHIIKMNANIYIRDCAFLGFPTVRVFIPEMICHPKLTAKIIQKKQKVIKWQKYSYGEKTENITIKDLIKTLDNIVEEIYPEKISKLPSEYLFFLCSVVLKDKKRIQKFIKRYKQRLNGQNESVSNILYDYYDLCFMNKSKKEIETFITQKYGRKFAEKTKMNELNFKIIKKYLIDSFDFEKLKKIIKSNPNTESYYLKNTCIMKNAKTLGLLNRLNIFTQSMFYDILFK